MGPQTGDVKRARVENVTDRLEQVVVLPTRYCLVANQRELRACGYQNSSSERQRVIEIGTRRIEPSARTLRTCAGAPRDLPIDRRDAVLHLRDVRSIQIEHEADLGRRCALDIEFALRKLGAVTAEEIVHPRCVVAGAGPVEVVLHRCPPASRESEVRQPPEGGCENRLRNRRRSRRQERTRSQAG